MTILVVTGTGTGIGKTVTTAALASCALRAGRTVAIVKPIQTGVVPGAPGDLAEIAGLTGHTDLHEYVRYSEPLAPATAARRLGEKGPELPDLADRIGQLVDRDLVLVEGAGGSAVRFNSAGESIIGLTVELARRHEVKVVLVASAGLGVLNVAALTAEAFHEYRLAIDSVVIGDWPAEPDLAQRCNLTDLAEYAEAPVRGVIPHGAGALDRAAFSQLALRSLAAEFGGTFDPSAFVQAESAPLPNREIDQ